MLERKRISMLSYEELLQQNRQLRTDLDEANETLNAIQAGEVDALIITTPQGKQVFTLKSADQLYRVLIEEMQNGAVTLANDGTILYCNRYFASLLSQPSEAILSHSIYAYVAAESIDTLRSFMQAKPRQPNMYAELNLQSTTGEVIPIHLAANALQFDQIDVTYLVITDLRAQKQRDEEINLLQSLGLEISQAHNLDMALRTVLERICLKTGWEVGEVWMLGQDHYHRQASWRNSKISVAFDEYSQNIHIPIGEGVVGHVWSSQTPVWFSNVTGDTTFLRQEMMSQVGIRSGVGFPVMVNSEIIAVILFLTTQSRPDDQHFVQLISTVVAHLGTYIVRKQAEEQNRYQAKFLETVRDPIISTDPDSIIVSWNHAAEMTYGWSAAEVIGKRYREVLPHQYPFDTPENVTKKFREQGHWTGELLQTTRSGRQLHVLCSLTMMRDGIGKPIRAVVTHRDITERKQEENELRENQERLRVALLALDLAVFNQDRDLRYTWMYQPQLGYSTDDVLGKSDEELLPVDGADEIIQIKRQVIERNKGDRQEISLRVNDQTFFYDLIVEPLHDSSGNIIGITGSTLDITERKKAEEALRESERFARSTVDALSAQIAILDETGTIIAVNQEWLRFAQNNGADPNYIWEGKNYLAICDAATTDIETARTVANGIRNIFQEGRYKRKSFIFEYSCPSPKEQRWFNVRVLPFVGDGPIRVVVAHENISERKLAENALLETHEQLVVLNRLMIQTNTTLDTRTLLNVACRELGQIFQVPQVVAGLVSNSDLTAKIIAEYTDNRNRSALGRNLPATSTDVQNDFVDIYKSPFAIKDAQNDPRVVFLRDYMIEQNIVSFLVIPLVSQGKLTGIIGVHTNKSRVFTESEMTLASSVGQVVSQSLENSLLHQDIAEQNSLLEQTVEKRTTQLKRLNERISTILDNTSDAIILTTLDGTIENTNLSFDRLFGYTRDEAFGQSIAMLSAAIDRQRTIGSLSKITQDTQPIPHLQILALRKDGSTFDADCGLAYVNDIEGFIVWSMRDITHLKAVERMKDQFVSMVSHELRTPLTGMVLSASSLQRYYERLNDQKRREIIDRLNNQGAVMVELIEGILDLSRIDSRSLMPGKALIDMRLMVEKVIVQLQDTISAKHHILNLNLGANSVFVIGSDMDFTRIWRNLLSNAIKYTPDGGTITLSLGLLSMRSPSDFSLSNTIAADSLTFPTDIIAGDYMIGQVADTGHGIPPKDLDQLFSRFFRGNASQSNVSGTGLGLALVRELLNLYGGNISVVSHLNAGSIFSFWIPTAKENIE